MTEKFIEDEEGTDLLLPKIEKSPKVQCRIFFVLSADFEKHRHMGLCLGHELLTSHGKATKTRTLTVERMETYKNTIAETERQHEEKRTRDIQVSKTGSGAASEEQSDKWRKTERLEHEAPNSSAFSYPCVALEYLASGERHSRRRSVLVRKSGQV